MKRFKLQPPTTSQLVSALMKRFGKQEESTVRRASSKLRLGLTLSRLTCECPLQENDPKLVKLHLIMLLAFEYV
jgi:hypothetical protein